jgi:hypothetical protein
LPPIISGGATGTERGPADSSPPIATGAEIGAGADAVVGAELVAGAAAIGAADAERGGTATGVAGTMLAGGELGVADAAAATGAAEAGGTIRTPIAPEVEFAVLAVGDVAAGGTITAVGLRISKCELPPVVPLDAAPLCTPPPGAAPAVGPFTIRNSVGTAPPAGGTDGINTVDCDCVAEAVGVAALGARKFTVAGATVAVGVGAATNERGGALERNVGRGSPERSSFDAEGPAGAWAVATVHPSAHAATMTINSRSCGGPFWRFRIAGSSVNARYHKAHSLRLFSGSGV